MAAVASDGVIEPDPGLPIEEAKAMGATGRAHSALLDVCLACFPAIESAAQVLTREAHAREVAISVWLPRICQIICVYPAPLASALTALAEIAATAAPCAADPDPDLGAHVQVEAGRYTARASATFYKRPRTATPMPAAAERAVLEQWLSSWHAEHFQSVLEIWRRTIGDTSLEGRFVVRFTPGHARVAFPKPRNGRGGTNQAGG